MAGTRPEAPRIEVRRAPAWVQSVDQPNEWAIEHRWLLDVTFAHFDETGDWPAIEEVQRTLADERPERAIQVRQLMIDIPPELGARHSQQVQLTVRALSFVPAARSLLEQFVTAMKDVVELYPGPGPGEPVLRGLDIKTAGELDDLTYRKLSTLLYAEPWFFGNGGGDMAGDWHRVVRAEILHLKGVDDIAGYLDTVARYRFGPPERQVEVVPDAPKPHGGVLRPPRAWLARRDQSNLDLLIIGILGGVVVAVIVAWLALS